MERYFILISYCCLAACSVNREPPQTDLTTGLQPYWLQDERELPAGDSLYYLDHPAPLFRKEFAIGRDVRQAKLMITAAGYYRATINGSDIEESVLDPAWTDYSKRVYYSDFDVTALLQDGNNCLGVALGNGFYNPLPLRKWGRRNLREDLAVVGKPAFIAKLVIQYWDGEVEEIVSDDSWTYAYGPMLKNSVYLGVVYDARRELRGWSTPGYDATSWRPAQRGASPGGQLQRAFFPPVQIGEELIPDNIYAPEPGQWMVDMGVNFTGTYRIKMSGNPGDTITFRFGERVYEDGRLNPMTSVIGQIKRAGTGGPGAPPVAWQTDTYIFGDQTEVWFQPDFTYHTYRYMEIAGLEKQPQPSDIRGLFLYTKVPDYNNFTASSELLNRIQEATERTFLANLVSVQSDCPAREKFGYGGDLNATSESFIYNFDMQDFYRKTVYDWVDAINDSVFVDTAPYVGIKYCGISWESAFLTTQYYLYLYYGDTDIISELYDLDKRWMDKVARLHPEGIVNQGLSDHESLEPVPVELTGTGHYLQCARIMETFAAVMGDAANQKKYGQLANRLARLIKERFWDRPIEGKINRQTLFSTLLYYDVLPPEAIPAATDSLLAAVRNGPAGHFNTGIFGTKFVLETLSEYVSPHVTFDVVNSTAYPGWGFMIDQGATTIWETWKESDNTYSNCHPMFGTVTEWYYRWLAGIRPDPAKPGFETFVLAPSTPGGLDSVQCSYRSPRGTIVSNWTRTAPDTYQFEMSVPEGSNARVRLPLSATQAVSTIKKGGEDISGAIQDLSSGQFTLGAGDYRIELIPKK